MKEKDYLEQLMNQIHCKKARKYVVREIKHHIEDQTEAYVKQGMTHEEAVQAAVTEMGDPVAVGESLDRIHRPQMEWRFMIYIITVSIISIFLQVMLGGRIFHPLQCAVGLILMLCICLVDYSMIGKWARTAATGFLFFFFIAAFILQPVTLNGMKGWIHIGPFIIALWLLLYLYVPIYGAYLYTLRGMAVKGIVRAVIYAVIPTLFALRMPNLTLAVSIFLIMMLMLSFTIAKGWLHVNKAKCLASLWSVIILLPAVILYWAYQSGLLAPYQSDRLRAFISGGDAKIHESIMQAAMSDWNSAGDYMITYLNQHYGKWTGTLVFVLLAILVWQILRISVKQKHQLGLIIGIGCGLVLGLQTFLYMLQNLSLIRTSLVYLPLFSIGSVGTIVTYCLLGLVLSIYRHQNVIPSIVDSILSAEQK